MENRELLEAAPRSYGSAAAVLVVAGIGCLLLLPVLASMVASLAVMLVLPLILCWMLLGRMPRLPVGAVMRAGRRTSAPRATPAYRFRVRTPAGGLVECLIVSPDGGSIDQGDDVEVWGRKELRTRRVVATRVHNRTTGTTIRRSFTGFRRS